MVQILERYFKESSPSNDLRMNTFCIASGRIFICYSDIILLRAVLHDLSPDYSISHTRIFRGQEHVGYAYKHKAVLFLEAE